MYFEDLPLCDDLLDALYDMHFDECTPVQEQCIPHILEEKDLIGIAQTGTGKTAAYLLPIVNLLMTKTHPNDAVNCLIMAPTRELARQIDQALQGFAYYTGIQGVAVYGGNDGARYDQEVKSLSKGADIVIATPGRLISHLSLGKLDLSRTTHLIRDEADRMLDMGFSEDILKIVECLPKERQTILFSATMPEKINAFARRIMNDPVEVRIAVSKPAEKISQSVYICRETDKSAIINHIFAEKAPERVILFAGSKQKVKELYATLSRKGFNVAAMHSDLQQVERDDVMNRFKARQIDLLVATDIVARGIDIDDITMVINFDAPRDAEDYVHRIGRTARAGREGRAITLVGERDMPALRAIESLLGAPVPRAELPEGMTAPEHGGSHDAAEKGGRGRGRKGRGKSEKHDDKGRAGRSHGRHDRPRREKKTDAAADKPATPAAAPAAEGQTQPADGQHSDKKKRTHRGGRHRRRGGHSSEGKANAQE